MIHSNILKLLALPLLMLCLSGMASADSPEAPGPALNEVSETRLPVAIGHYERARRLLLEAVREFDQGLKIANPDLLVDSNGWRDSVLADARSLERVVSPKAEAPMGGVQFEANPAFTK